MSRRSRQKTWTYAGAGLIFCGVVEAVQTSLNGTLGMAAFQVITGLAFAVSILLFAFGFTPDASVVARRPLGVTALTIVAVWPFAAFAITRGLMPLAGEAVWSIYGYVALLIPAAAALVAAAQIGRNGKLPRPWRWAPMWVLGLYALTWAIPQIIFVTERPETIQGFADLFRMFGSLASLAGTLGLGILAIVLAAKQRPESVEVYPAR
ncbi:hypothetical protein [Microbacterium sp. PMB16]|uniref:hypothetical protein n=1 Tax=Microbacterium sp. PMB16 TaxID=3120157 RepID=UPI003F4BC25C